jgi:uncharacterized BrkB/YihY/UPF0761 family membrane protein
VPDAPPERPGPDDTNASTAGSRLTAWGRARAENGRARASAQLERHRHRAPVDLALRLYERDREAAGTVIGGALAFQLFLFFVPMLLFVVGLLGFLSDYLTSKELDDLGLAGGLAVQIQNALSQPTATRWIATITGLVGMVTAGRSLTRVMTVASCLAWRLPVRPKASVRAVGGIVGLVVGMGVVAIVVGKLRQEVGVGAAGVSFVVALGAYVAGWMLLSMPLPRGTSDPGALVPGAILVAATLVTLQVISQLYVPDQVSRASELYGALGAIVVALGWFFFVGRAVVLSMIVNAVVFERFGSASSFVFGLPILRALPRRWAWFRRTFELESPSPEDPAS